MENQPSHLMLTSAAGLNVIRHLHENSLCELALQYLLQVSCLLIHDQNFCFEKGLLKKTSEGKDAYVQGRPSESMKW